MAILSLSELRRQSIRRSSCIKQCQCEQQTLQFSIHSVHPHSAGCLGDKMWDPSPNNRFVWTLLILQVVFFGTVIAAYYPNYGESILYTGDACGPLICVQCFKICFSNYNKHTFWRNKNCYPKSSMFIVLTFQIEL